MGLKEALMRLGFDPNISIDEIDEDTVRIFYRAKSKQFHPDYHKGDKEAEVNMQKLNEAKEEVLKEKRKGIKRGKSPKFIADYEQYKAMDDTLTSLKRNKYYPKLTEEKYIKMYAAAIDKKLEIYVNARKKRLDINIDKIEKDLNLNAIIEQYRSRQEIRDSINRHIDISFEYYFSLYIRLYGLINLDNWIDEYAKGGEDIHRHIWLFNKKMSLNEFLNSKTEKEEGILR